MSYLVMRFLIGGAIVSAFAATGELFKPKTFAGLFGAAPAVALATLAVSFAQDGGAAVAMQARWMLAASLALVAYSALCVFVCRKRGVPVWIGAAAAWVAWFAVAGVLWLALQGALPA